MKTSIKQQQQQPQKTTKKIKKNTVVIERQGKSSTMVYKVPHCAEHYFDSLVDPFSTETGVCIPCDLFPMPSQKVKVYTRGTFQIGSSGIGFIMVSPQGVNDEISHRYTSPTSISTTSAPLSATTNIQSNVSANLPYSKIDLDELKIQKRLVAVGVRCKYIGKLMDQQGIVYALEEPDHNNILTLSFNQLTQFQYTRPDRVGQMKDWDSTASYSGPVSPQELEYAQALVTDSILGLVVSGGSNDNYEYEIVEHYEYIGTKAAGRTPSHADAHAFGKVMEVAKNATANQPLQPSMARPLWSRFKEAVTEGLPKLISGAVQVVSSAFSGDLSKLASGSGDLYRGVNPAVRALMETPATRGHMATSPYLALPPPRLIVK